MEETHLIVAGIDVGNGYTKAVLQTRTPGSPLAGTSDVVDLPSSVAVLTRPNALPTPDAEAKAVMDVEPTGTDGFYNELDCSFASSLVLDHYRRLFGQRSLTADAALDSFDIVSRTSKARQPLAKALVLGLLAAKALRDHVRVHGELPDGELRVTARVALPLPINEFMAHREAFAAEFLAHDHICVIENFETKATVRIAFEDVQVLAEGASAQYAILRLGDGLADKMLADVRRHADAALRAQLEGVTGHDVLAASNTVGVDVGEGTTDFPVFTNGRFNPDASTTFPKGWGTVLENALRSMSDQGIETGFIGRRDLAEFLHRTPSKLKRGLHDRVGAMVAEEARFFADEVAERLAAVLRAVGATTEVGYVYGGGAGPVRDALYPALTEKIAAMNTLGSFPVLYLDETYSRHLNREGLFIAATSLADRAGR